MQEIGTQIPSIREEAFRPAEDQDDLMLPSCEEGENKGSRGHGNRFAKHSYNKKKGKEVKFATESDSKGDEPDNNKADDTDENDITVGMKVMKEQVGAAGNIRRKYKLLGSVVFPLLIMNTDQSDGRSCYKLCSYRKVWW